MQKKTSTWVTIREESPISMEVPAKQEAIAGTKRDANEFVQNKLFWGASFVVLLVFTAALIAPGQFLALLKGNLFDTTEYEAEVVQDAAVVQASTGAVDVQVEPVSSNQKMLEELKLQLEEFKKSGQESDASIALLTQLVESEMHAAAGNATDADITPAPIDLSTDSSAPVQNPPVQETTIPVQTTPAITQDAVSTAAASNVNLGQNINLGLGTPTKDEVPAYRLNPYRVQLDPYQILQQNMAVYGTQANYQQGTYYAQLQQGMQGNAVYGAQAYNAQAYNSQLSNVKSTPNSGPHESLMIAFGLTFLGLAFRKGFKLFMGR